VRLNEVSEALPAMKRDIVPDDHLARTKLRDEHLLHNDLNDITIDRAFDL
jgi:hypothetical protein